MSSLDDYLSDARENWRVVLLAALLLMSAVGMFAPSATDGPTNLQYGLELNGGARVRAPFVGTTADVTGFEGMNQTGLTTVERSVASDLDLPLTDVNARPRTGQFEVYAENVSGTALTSALEDAGLQVSNVRPGVTEATRENAREVIEQKLASSPDLTGGSVQLVQTPTGDNFMLVEVPNAQRNEVIELIETRGLVQVVAVFPSDAAGQSGNNSTAGNGTVGPTGTGEFDAPPGYRAVPLLTQDEMPNIGQAQEADDGSTSVPVTLTDRAGQNFSESMQKWGFTGEGVENCQWRVDQTDPGWCLVTVRDGNVVYSASMGGGPNGLADLIESGDFTKTNSFVMQTTNISEARDLQIDLQAGALPTDLAIDEGTTSYVQPSQGQRFKLFSLVTGVIAAVAVAVVVFARYGDSRVAAPMFVTALSEVFILLGFAAATGLAMDLSHIAGFIAVIGTGVDDLVIIADEVLAQGEVRTRRVFQSRFRKAFWVIGAAAVTTIIAMSPLTVLSLGDLSGFAVVTIVGVLIGVLVTRPAYGDILRSLVTTDG